MYPLSHSVLLTLFSLNLYNDFRVLNIFTDTKRSSHILQNAKQEMEIKLWKSPLNSPKYSYGLNR